MKRTSAWPVLLAAVSLSVGCTESRPPAVEVASSQPASAAIVLRVGIDANADGEAAVTFFDGFGARHREVGQSTVRMDQRAAVFVLKEGVSAATAVTLADELRASELVTTVVVETPTP